MSGAPPVVDVLIVGSRSYRKIMVCSRKAARKWKVDLGRPTRELVEKAIWYTKKLQKRLRNESGYNGGGSNYNHNNPQGQIGAELLANYYNTVAGWDWTKSDPGFDLRTQGGRVRTRVDVKTRQGLLTIEPRHIRLGAEYYALVVQRDDGPYLFCGVIPPTEYVTLAQTRPLISMPGGLAYWVGAHELRPPAHFHPKER